MSRGGNLGGTLERRWRTRADLDGEVRSHPRLGHRMGYVYLPRSHPWHGKGIHDRVTDYTPPTGEISIAEGFEGFGVLPVFIAALGGNFDEDFKTLAYAVRVHGGLTYADGEPDGSWVLGFDCGHAGDSPDPTLIGGRLFSLMYDPDGVVWTHDMVVEEVEWLARQIPPVPRPPFWTRCERGVIEAERDRRRRARSMTMREGR